MGNTINKLAISMCKRNKNIFSVLIYKLHRMLAGKCFLAMKENIKNISTSPNLRNLQKSHHQRAAEAFLTTEHQYSHDGSGFSGNRMIKLKSELENNFSLHAYFVNVRKVSLIAKIIINYLYSSIKKEAMCNKNVNCAFNVVKYHKNIFITTDFAQTKKNPRTRTVKIYFKSFIFKNIFSL